MVCAQNISEKQGDCLSHFVLDHPTCWSDPKPPVSFANVNI